MPVPWGDKCTRIPQVEHRAITIQQLRDMEVFLQRLCKTMLLRGKGPDGTFDGRRIRWFEINMYDISDLVIKRVIEHVEAQRLTNGRYSWVEFVASEKQEPHVLYSHSWAGRFRDFMSVARNFVRDSCLSCCVAVWICTFANNQFGEDFGAGLQDSPFYKAIQGARGGTLLVVDRGASSLQRIWCGLELHLTMQMEKDLQVYTSVGKVGMSVTSGGLVDEIESWDVTRMEASQDSDRRQILNFLCRGQDSEKDGLKKDEHGNLAVVDGWRKQLECQATTEDCRPRSNGKKEYAHEARLFKECEEAVTKLNKSVQKVVRDAVKVQVGPERPTMRSPRPEDRAVTLAELRCFDKMVKNWVAANFVTNREGSRLSYQDLSIFDVFHKFVATGVCTKGNQSYAEAVSTERRRAQYAVDETWHGKFADFMSSIEWFAEAQKMVDSTLLHIAPLCMDPFNKKEEDERWENTQRNLLLNSEGLLCCLPNRQDLIIRCNRMKALQICFENAKNIYLACPTGVLACTTPFPDSLWVFGHFSSELGQLILDANWEEASGSMDEAKIKKHIRDSRGGFKGFAARLARVAAGPVLRAAAGRGDEAALQVIRKVSTRSGFLITSAVMRGGLGETPAHIAAAAGNVDALKVLLDHHADVNAEDLIRETPMHYAAITGKVQSVRLLLKYGAQWNVESAFAETPLYVAEQNPAAFLGVKTCRVVALLRAWAAAADSDSKHGLEEVLEQVGITQPACCAGDPNCVNSSPRKKHERGLQGVPGWASAFNMLDREKDGTVSEDVFFRVMDRIGMPRDQMQALLVTSDALRDGRVFYKSFL